MDQQLADATPHMDRIPRVAIEATIAETREREEAGLAEDGQRAQWNAILEIVALLARPPPPGAGGWRPSRHRRCGSRARTIRWPTPRRLLLWQPPGPTGRSVRGLGHLPQLEDPVWTFKHD